MNKTSFVCNGIHDDSTPLVYHETPRKDRGDEFFVFFNPQKGDFEPTARRLFRNLISVSRLGHPLQYFSRVLDLFREETCSDKRTTDFISGSIIVLLVRRGMDAYVLRNRAVETLHWDSACGIDGHVETIAGVEELGLGGTEGQGELFDKTVEESFILQHFRIPSGTHTLIFFPSGEFAQRYRETLLDSIFFPSFESGEGIELETDLTFPAMHWSISSVNDKSQKTRTINRRMARKWIPAMAVSTAVLAAIFLIFNPFGEVEPGLPAGHQILLNIGEEKPDLPAGQDSIGNTGDLPAAESKLTPPIQSGFTGTVNHSPVRLANGWKKKFDAPVTSSPAVTQSGVIFGCRDGNVYSFTLDGKMNWKYQAGLGVGASPFCIGDRVLCADYEGNIFCVDAMTGRRAWNFKTGEKIVSSPKADERMVVAATTGGSVIALDINDGKLLWSVKIGASIWASPAIGEGYIIAATTDGSLVRLNRSGKIAWNLKPGGSIYSSPLCLENKDLVIVGTGNKFICAYSLTDGNLLWRTDTGGDMRGSPAYDGVNIFMGSEDGMLHAVSIAGVKMWKMNLGGAIRSTPLIIDDLVLVTSYGSRLTVLKCGDGSLVDEYRTESPLFSSPATDGNLVFFGSIQGFLHAVTLVRGVS